MWSARWQHSRATRQRRLHTLASSRWKGGPASIMVTQGVIYLAYYDNNWREYDSEYSRIASERWPGALALYSARFRQATVASGGDDLVLIALQDGSIDALRASSGALRWHRAMSG